MYSQVPFAAPAPPMFSGAPAPVFCVIFVLIVLLLASLGGYAWVMERRTRRAMLRRSNPAKFWLQMTINEEASAILERTLVQNVLTEEPARRKR